jgi:hypothetical protein
LLRKKWIKVFSVYDKATSPGSNKVTLAGIEQSHPRVGLQVRRLEMGTFQFPFAETGRKEIAAWESGLLLEGIDLGKGQRRKRYSLPTGCPEGPVTTGPEEAPETS